MDRVIDVATGEVKVGKDRAILASNGIGSCVVVVALDTERRVGGIAHIMLAGKAPDKEKVKTKYAADAIESLLMKMHSDAAPQGDLKVFIVGGGNVLRLEDDRVCSSNIESAGELLRKKGFRIIKEAVGGAHRRTVRLDMSDCTVYCSEGNGKEQVLWQAGDIR